MRREDYIAQFQSQRYLPAAGAAMNRFMAAPATRSSSTKRLSDSSTCFSGPLSECRSAGCWTLFTLWRSPFPTPLFYAAIPA